MNILYKESMLKIGVMKEETVMLGVERGLVKLGVLTASGFLNLRRKQKVSASI